MTHNIQVEKRKLLSHMLNFVPEFGWSEKALEAAASACDVEPSYAKLLFIGGIGDIIELYFDYIDELMFMRLADVDMSKLGITAKAKLALNIRLNILSEYRGVVSRTVSHLSLPWNAPLGLRLTWRTVDGIWSGLLGDASTDFNYYTKRGLLYFAYVASLNYMLADYSEDLKDTQDFVSRKIDNIVSVGKRLSKVISTR